MPKIAEIEDTPNPNALKFTLREPLTWGVPHSYESAAEAEGDELARALFAIEHVTNVFYVDRWLTVTAGRRRRLEGARSQDRGAAARGAGRRRTLGDHGRGRAGPSFEHLSERDQDRLDAIDLLLDEQIRPYLQGDGGDLHILGLDGDRLVVHYQGACGTCPSSISGTLRGIESLLRTIEPDLEVVAA